MDAIRRFAAMALLLAGTLATGCTMGPDYHRPVLDMPESYRFASAEQAESFANLPWWEVFKDPYLQDLIRTALANNYDLKQAVARVEQARNIAVAAKSPLFPQVNYGADLGRGKNAIFNTPASNGSTETSLLAAVNVAWEIDVWGRIQRLSEAAEAEYFASEQARRGIAVILVSDVATAYYQLLDLDRELAIQHDAVIAYERTLRLFNDRRGNGVASKLETDRAETVLATASAIIPDLENRISLTENQLNVLLGRNMEPIVRASAEEQLDFTPPEIPAGLPSELLERRPDVLASEQSLIAANADIGANLANFYPRIGLTAFFGKASPDLSDFSNGSTNMANVGASLVGPIFQGGRIRAEYRAAVARFEEAAAAYRQSVLTAFREVSDSLITRQKLVEAKIHYARAVDASASAVQLSTDRYINGKSSYFEVLQSQQDLYPAQRTLVQTEIAEFIAVIQLYKALGGGWSPEEEAGQDAATPEPANP